MGAAPADRERRMLRLVPTGITLIVSSLLLAPGSALACSLVGCLNRGIEVRPKFVVAVRYQGRPLRGTNVQVTDNTSGVRFAAATGSNGAVQIETLAPGDYWLNAELLGTGVAYLCFHVAEHPSPSAKRRMTYQWGEFASATQRLAGKLVDSQPGTGPNPIWNLVHRVDVPIREARLRLQNPVTSETYNAVSDQDGNFAIDGAPRGIYILHIEGGRGAREYEGTDLPISLDPHAKRDTLILSRREASAGSCGGTSLEVR
jgi:hypothetical protein